MTLKQREREPSLRVEPDVCLRIKGLLDGIGEQPDVEICACEHGITRVNLGDRLGALAETTITVPATSDTANVLSLLSEGHLAAPEDSSAALRYAFQAAQEIADYLRGARERFSVPLAPAATSPFSVQVHEAIATIPYGQRWTYAKLAASLGKPGATRAVGTACGKNPLPILVPCHRVVRADGALGRYTGGDAIKAGLLAIETQS